jgi:uncharacterized protein YndB with AHSA1/START domain
MTTTLAEALPFAEFFEHHSRVISAPPVRVWRALHRARWADLRLTAPLLLVRGLVDLRDVERFRRWRLLDDGPVRVLEVEEGRYLAGGRIAQPWHAVPVLGPEVSTLAELAAFDTGSWLKYGMDFRLNPLPGGRTRLDTSTLCQPTDDVARRRFGAYWRVIGPFSSLIRHDLLRAVARLSTAGDDGDIADRTAA